MLREGRAGAAFLLLCAAACLAGDKAILPQPGQVFCFSPDTPKHVTCDVEFRHPEEKLWPCFFYGRPAEGQFQYDPANPKAAFRIVCDKMCQPHGDQSRKVIGELIQPEKPPAVAFTVRSVSPLGKDRTEALGDTDKGRRPPGDAATLDAVLDIGGKQLPVKAEAVFRYEGDKNGVQARVIAHFTIQGADLGLKAEEAKGPIKVRVEALAVATEDAPGKRK